jgi:hypothetical protein
MRVKPFFLQHIQYALKFDESSFITPKLIHNYDRYLTEFVYCICQFLYIELNDV